jgi:Egh16-like virulence factor
MAGMEGVCMVRCDNAARAGPFGGCVPVQMASEAGNASAAARMARSFQA